MDRWWWVRGKVTTSDVASGSGWDKGSCNGRGGRGNRIDCRGNAGGVAGPSRWMDREVDNRCIAWRLLTDNICY